MYAYLTGQVAHVGPDFAVLDVHGVGYQLACGSRTLGVLEHARQAKTPVQVHTYLHVREDVLALFGFADAAEKNLFVLLTGVNGLGPKLGLSLLSTFAPNDIVAAIQHGQPSTLARASGVGKKLAEKIILDLKDKLGQVPGLAGTPLAVATAAGGVVGDVVSALLNLGYSAKAAEQAVATAAQEHESAGFELLFKASLKKLSAAA